MQNIFNNRIYIFSLVFPGMLIFVFAVLTPIVLSVFFGITKYDAIGPPIFVGLKNFKTILFEDPVFWRSLLNAIFLAAALILIQHPLSIMFAIFIDRIGGLLEEFFRAVYFIPCVLSIVVTSQMWLGIYQPQFGLLNKFLEAIGLGSLTQIWLGDPNIALPAIIVVIMWQGFGWAMLIYYAGLKGIPTELYEAAEVDGATGLTTYFKITIPLLKPVIRVNVTLAIISALKQMEVIYLTTNGGPYNSTQLLGNYLYTKAFSEFKYGYANAIAVLFVIVCLIATYFTNKFTKTEALY